MILTTWEKGEFKELLISRKLLEIELNRFHFRRLCFFEVFEAEIHFFDQHFFEQICPRNLDLLGLNITLHNFVSFTKKVFFFSQFHSKK